MKKILYFIKWNFTDMQPHTKRMFAYFALGIGAEVFVNGGIILAPAFMFIDFTVDIIKSQYRDFKKEQKDILDALKDDS